MKGSLKLLETSREKVEDLRKKVTSKGGTTAAALDVFTKNKIQATFKDALKAAKQRSKELTK
jgi:pyrroline-5-carboxylate reductase